MGMLDFLAPYKSLISLLLVVFGPSLLPRALALLNGRSRPRTTRPTSAPLTLPLKIFLALQTAYLVYKLVLPPYDLFYNLPILSPNAILRKGTGPHISDLEELLLTRLQSYDNRLNYARFGHRTLLECVWCENTADYWVFALPSILGPYVLETIVLGLLGLKVISGPMASIRVAQWRGLVSWTLGCACAGEIGSRYLWELRVDKGDTIHLNTILYTLRQILLLALPLLYTLLPLSASSADMSVLVPTLINTQNTIRLTGLTRTAISRDARFRALWSRSGQLEADQLTRARTDPELQEMVSAAGLDPAAGQAHARRWVREGWQGLVRINH